MGDHTLTNDKADALIRAGRTLWTSVGVDAAVAIGAGTLLLLDGGDPTNPVFWGALGALVVRSVVTSVATYFARLKVTPKNV